jgi:hypothetical protein
MNSPDTTSAAAYDQGARDAFDVFSIVLGFCLEKHGSLLRLEYAEDKPPVFHFQDGTELIFVRDDLRTVGKIIGMQQTEFYFGVRHPGDEDWTYRALKPGPQG